MDMYKGEYSVTFPKLFTIRNQNNRNPEADNDETRRINHLVRETGDDHRKFFKDIYGFREKINDTLREHEKYI